MPNTGFLGWAYISGSTISFDSGVADKQVLFMSGTSVVSGASNLQFDYGANALILTGNLTASGHVSASTYHGDGSNLSGISASPGGSNRQIQFNNGGAFGGDAGLTYNSSTDSLTTVNLTASGHTILGSGVTNSDITVNGFLENSSSAGARSYRLFIESQNLNQSENYGEYLYNLSVTGAIGKGILGYINSSSKIDILTASVTGSGIESLLGFIAGNNAVDGFLTRGYCRPGDLALSSSTGTGSLDVGTQVYADPTTPGGFTTVKPTTAGHCVRVVGHSVTSNIIFFNPSPDFIEL